MRVSCHWCVTVVTLRAHTPWLRTAVSPTQQNASPPRPASSATGISSRLRLKSTSVSTPLVANLEAPEPISGDAVADDTARQRRLLLRPHKDRDTASDVGRRDTTFRHLQHHVDSRVASSAASNRVYGRYRSMSATRASSIRPSTADPMNRRATLSQRLASRLQLPSVPCLVGFSRMCGNLLQCHSQHQAEHTPRCCYQIIHLHLSYVPHNHPLARVHGLQLWSISQLWIITNTNVHNDGGLTKVRALWVPSTFLLFILLSDSFQPDYDVAGTPSK